PAIPKRQKWQRVSDYWTSRFGRSRGFRRQISRHGVSHGRQRWSRAKTRPKLRLTLLVNLLPNSVSRLSNTALFDQFTCHRAHQVGVFFDTGQTFAAELSFHHHRNENLPAHETNAVGLH